MKKQTLILLIAILFTFSVSAQKVKRSINLMEMVVEIPKSDPGKTWNELKDVLNSMKNVSVEGYCPGQKLLYLRIDPTEYFNVLVAINEAGFTYYMKQDTNLSQGIKDCIDKKDLYLKESSSLD